MPWIDIGYARSIVAQMYPTDTWRKRVKGMPDGQVLAIYCRREEDRAKKKPTIAVNLRQTEGASVTKKVFIPDVGEQLSFI